MKLNNNWFSNYTAVIFCALSIFASTASAETQAALGSGTTEAAACQQAKMLAQQYCGGKVTSFERCSCGMKIVNRHQQWSCQVDAHCGPRTGIVKPEIE